MKEDKMLQVFFFSFCLMTVNRKLKVRKDESSKGKLNYVGRNWKGSDRYNVLKWLKTTWKSNKNASSLVPFSDILTQVWGQ